MELSDRVRGGVLGGAIGDALGAPIDTALEGRHAIETIADDFTQAVTNGEPDDPTWALRYPPDQRRPPLIVNCF